MDSKDLLGAVQVQDKLSKSFVGNSSTIEQNRLPSYLETKNEQYQKYEGVDDSKVQVLQLNMS